MLGSSLLLGWHPESMSCFSSLYLARARQDHIRWGKKLQTRVQFPPSPEHGLSPSGSTVSSLGLQPLLHLSQVREEGFQDQESPSTSQGLGDCPPMREHIVP